MPGWTLVGSHPALGRTFRRPLSVVERGYFWDGLFNGTADSLQHLQLRLANSHQDVHLFSEANVTRAWLSTKRRYPLAGAIVQGHEQALNLASDHRTGVDVVDETNAGDAELHFVIKERDISHLRSSEIVFGQVANEDEARQRATGILNGTRPLSSELLVRLYIFYQVDSEMAQTSVLHMMMITAHCITDGIADKTLKRCFLDTLARGERPDAEPIQVPLEDRLAMIIPAEELEPLHLRALNPARRRWRKAIATVIFQLRLAKRQGGHTVPCRVTRSTQYTAARSCMAVTSLTRMESATVVANCRRYDITFGNALHVLSQVAMTRVLYRRYIRGEISKEEWAYRRKQPYIFGTPINMRPFLDKAWFKRGGGGEFVLSIGYFITQLPFMTLSGTAAGHSEQRGLDTGVMLSDGAPPFSDLLTFDRFLYRIGLLKREIAASFSHPLFLEILHATNMTYGEHQRLVALQGIKRANTGGHDGNLDQDEALALTDTPRTLAPWSSSLGDVDLIYPLEYPLPPTHKLSPYSPAPHPVKAGYVVPSGGSLPLSSPESVTATAPTIIIEYGETHLHARPGEIYLIAGTTRGHLRLNVYYDGNVFQEDVVTEWLDEVREAVLWYLVRVKRGQATHARL